MKKSLKVVLKVLGALLLLSILVGVGVFYHVKSTHFDFEGDYPENQDLQELTIDSYTFVDRNGNGELDVYEDERRTIDERVDDVLAQMTMEEKIHLLKGSGIASAAGFNEPGEGIPGAVGTIVPTPRLGLPTVYLSDGPAGLRIQPTREGEDRTYYCTAFPIATLLASTWNQELVYQVGEAIGNEAQEYGLDVVLGPGMNLHRHPLCGRNFEYYSEDPVLSGYIAAAMVNGIESNEIGASVKHFVANNQETDRDLNDVIISERALREIYLKGFEIVVREAQPWTIMSSYNKVNGEYTSESEYLLTDVLRDDWGFEGLVMTDWFGGRDAAAQISVGNDLLEPGTRKQWKALSEAADQGTLSEAAIDQAARRILMLIFKTRKLQDYQYGNDPDLDAHAEITRQSATEGITLLKNKDALPLRAAMNVALLGSTSYDFIAGGTGSGDVNEAYTISLEEGLANAGFEINAEAKAVYEQHRSANAEAFTKPEGSAAAFTPYQAPEMTFTDEQLTTIVASSDIGILTIGRNAGEGGDRVETDDFLLSAKEQEMIKGATAAFHAAGKKLVVVLNIGGVIETASWKEQPDAILLAWQGGQEGGNSVADILSGAVSPSGKLPMTFPVRLADHASHTNFPEGGEEQLTMAGILTNLIFGLRDERPDAEKVATRDYTNYDEGIYVGYRHFDKVDLEVSYPFGFGLSYTEFEYADLSAELRGDSIHIKATIQNTGASAGKEIAQVFVTKTNTTIDRPEQELKAFTKTQLLAPATSETISLSIPVADLRYWDETKDQWSLESGAYEIKLGASSRDIRQVVQVEL
ncbi:MAG: glycoside hydrolase family 3 N-terminal domain-containing protein [Bacteroidota bacterium]